MKNSGSRVLMIAVLLSLVLVYEDTMPDVPYAVLLFGVPVAVFIKLIAELQYIGTIRACRSMLSWRHSVSKLILLYLSFLCVFSWFYGVFIGLLGGFEPAHVFRNFFGLLLYFLFPLLHLFNPSSVQLVKLVLAAGGVQLLIALASFDPTLAFTHSASELTSISDARSSYSAGYIVIFPLLATTVGVTLLGAGKPSIFCRASAIGVFVTAAFSVTVVTASKGFILAFILLMLIIVAAWIKRNTINLISIAVSFFAFFMSSASPNEGFIDLLIVSFTTSESGNSIRAEQAIALMNELSFFGSGLGSNLVSGYRRDETGYGFELTYLNLIHKLGVFCIPLFLLYLYTVIASIAFVWRRPHSVASYTCLGGCGYMVVGIGNPLLLAPFSVTLHCIIMYLLSNFHWRRSS
jgi:hypothetical protein